MWMTINHLITNSTKLAHYRLKIRKVIEFFEFQSLTQHSLLLFILSYKQIKTSDFWTNENNVNDYRLNGCKGDPTAMLQLLHRLESWYIGQGRS